MEIGLAVMVKLANSVFGHVRACKRILFSGREQQWLTCIARAYDFVELHIQRYSLHQ